MYIIYIYIIYIIYIYIPYILNQSPRDLNTDFTLVYIR